MKRVIIGSVQGKPRLITKAKRAFATLAIAGMIASCNGTICSGPSSPGAATQKTTSAKSTDTPKTGSKTKRAKVNDNELPFNLKATSTPPPEKLCFNSYPFIEELSAEEGVDPGLVRALAFTQSNFDECAVLKTCRQGFDGPDCFAPGPAMDAGYMVGYDQMHDPDGKCIIALSPNSNTDSPDWRFLGLGIMQGLEPPHTFWPASDHPDNYDGIYSDIFLRSGMGSLNLDDAKACNPRFSPFNARDSLCLGAKKMSRAMKQARQWIESNREFLNWSENNKEADRIFSIYVAAHIYAGTWNSRGMANPKCEGSMGNGDCWARGFRESWSVDEEYCQENPGKIPPECDSLGVPRFDPPHVCYGVTDFMQYVRDCEPPHIGRQWDIGQNVLYAYRMQRSCPNSKKRP